MNSEYELYDQIGAVDVYFESKQQSKIEHRLSKYYNQFETDIKNTKQIHKPQCTIVN